MNLISALHSERWTETRNHYPGEKIEKFQEKSNFWQNKKNPQFVFHSTWKKERAMW